jgi:hypothetical protein
MGISVANVEAGLRGMDMTMREEKTANSGHTHSLLFVTQQSGVKNPMREDAPTEKIFSSLRHDRQLASTPRNFFAPGTRLESWSCCALPLHYGAEE